MLSSSSTSITLKARPRVSFVQPLAPAPRSSIPALLQRRWASGEAEATREDQAEEQTAEDTEAPISKLQPTAQEEVENAIATDNAADADVSAQPDVHSSEAAETSTVDSTIEGVKSAASSAVEGAQSMAAGAIHSVTGSSVETSRQTGLNPEPKPTVYVGNLFFDVTENDLTKDFARFGNIHSCRIIRDARGLSKG